MTTNLLQRTNSLLTAALASGKTLRSIALLCGQPVEYDWLKRFAAGQIKDPSVNRIQAMHDKLREDPALRRRASRKPAAT